MCVLGGGCVQRVECGGVEGWVKEVCTGVENKKPIHASMTTRDSFNARRIKHS